MDSESGEDNGGNAFLSDYTQDDGLGIIQFKAGNKQSHKKNYSFLNRFG